MDDTPEYIKQMQFDIIFKKSNEEKLRMTMEMIDTSLEMAYNLIKKQNPQFSHRQIIAERFEMLYKTDFENEELQKIKKHLLEVQG